MAKETVKARNARFSDLLGMLDARQRELNKLSSEVKSLKEQVKSEVPPGTYGDWIRAEGTPRQVLDQAAVRADYQERGVPLPMKTTDAPIVITPKVAR
jgi:hypothetical protein